jgi:hypothetical protein
MKFKPFSLEYWSDSCARMSVYFLLLFAIDKIVMPLNDMSLITYIPIVILLVIGIDRYWPKVSYLIPLWPYNVEDETTTDGD